MSNVRLKVFSGTRSAHAPRLCDSCEYGVVRKGVTDSEEQVHCTMTKSAVKTRVIECSRYQDRSTPSLWDMRQIAWVLHTDSRRQKIGFIRAKEWERTHEDEELLPGC